MEGNEPLSLEIEKREITIDSVQIHYRAAGSGEALVLIHGLAGSTHCWDRNIARLAAHFHVHAIDLMGFGESRGNHHFVLSDAARYLVKWLDRLGIDRAHLAGHSMGGFIAADLAADYPNRVGRLVLVDPAIFPAGSRLTRYATGLTGAIRSTPVDFLPVLIHDSVQAGPRTIWRAANQLIETDIRPKLARIKAPTLVVWGEDDTLTPPELGNSIAASIPTSRFTTIPSAGHNPMWDHPAMFNQAVLDFLSSDLAPADPASSS